MNLSQLFYGCSSLKSLPDISKWNIDNVENTELLFAGCSSLKSLPDISKWNLFNNKNKPSLFHSLRSMINNYSNDVLINESYKFYKELYNIEKYRDDMEKLIKTAIAIANQRVYDMSLKVYSLSGMGTTVCHF